MLAKVYVYPFLFPFDVFKIPYEGMKISLQGNYLRPQKNE